MKRIAVALGLLLCSSTLTAHVSPPRILIKEMDAARLLLPEAQTLTGVRIKLNDAQKRYVKQQCNWTPDESHYQALVGRDAESRYVGAVVIIGEMTVHGLVRLAVAFEASGRIKGSTVVAITDEAYGWVKPLLDQNYGSQFVGKDHKDVFSSEHQSTRPRRTSMSDFYSRILASLLHRCAVICYIGDVAKAQAF
jgi:hypothetical protein